ncbi:sensor domain-containing diguanylate cyclase [Kosakonia sp. BYX6]|uniref:Sensor domain-containing diguanylate cyclase n=1 Tax=Kosakonia calanthes TaxID=3139408 RepID=A0ABZ3B8D5_9ENTR
MLNEIMVSGRKLEIEAVNYMEDNAFVSLVLDTSGRLIHASPFFYQLTGFTPDEVAGQVLFQSPDESVSISLLMAINSAKSSGDNWQGEISQRKKNGDVIWLDTRLMPKRDDNGEIFAFILLGFDITRHMAIREKLHFRAHNDALTKTLNRQGYYIRSRKKIRAANARDAQIVVAILDLDNFKNINDDLGHAAGDEVLRCFISRVKQCISRTTLLGRLGGDEFALTYIDGVDETAGRGVLQLIVEATRQPMYLHYLQQTVALSVSIGVASYPEHGTNFSSILKAADTALYKVKARGGDNYINYQVPGLNESGSVINSVVC